MIELSTRDPYTIGQLVAAGLFWLGLMALLIHRALKDADASDPYRDDDDMPL